MQAVEYIAGEQREYIAEAKNAIADIQKLLVQSGDRNLVKLVYVVEHCLYNIEPLLNQIVANWKDDMDI